MLRRATWRRIMLKIPQNEDNVEDDKVEDDDVA